MASEIVKPGLIALFTDFGVNGPYHGQMQALLAAAGVEQPVIQLMVDAPRFAPRPSAYLLAAIANDLPPGTVVIAVVDPGVGGERRSIMVKDSDQWFIGPDNGLLSQVARRSGEAKIEEIVWRPERLSNSFHGRDLFSPVAAAVCKLVHESGPELSYELVVGADWPDSLEEIIYIDDFGNAVCGIRATTVDKNTLVVAAGNEISYATTFSQVNVGEPFWYENSIGLVEIAVNQGSAEKMLGLEIGSQVGLEWFGKT
jgi:S-adenosylmethionine hydrolase